MRIESYSNKDLLLSFSPHEVAILRQLSDSLVALLATRKSQKTSAQADDMQAGGMHPNDAEYFSSGPRDLPADAALARLLPNAYEDEEESSDFRSITEGSLISQKLNDINILQEALQHKLAPTTGEEIFETDIEVCINRDTLPHWVRSLTAIRLTLAARLGIESEADVTKLREANETNENYSSLSVSDWLAGIIETILHFQPHLDAEENHA
ncbi:MAG TPA: DUF2017 family protein [Microbacteriaceae bacterium]|nr:DUF2017 family protein [Microbacteriaceae bacterium]